jgi:O-phosphoseryl-tRNA(Cys) synthetase
VQHAAAFSFERCDRQRQRKDSAARLGDTHAASCFFTTQCSIFTLTRAQQLS